MHEMSNSQNFERKNKRNCFISKLIAPDLFLNIAKLCLISDQGRRRSDNRNSSVASPITSCYKTLNEFTASMFICMFIFSLNNRSKSAHYLIHYVIWIHNVPKSMVEINPRVRISCGDGPRLRGVSN